MPRVQRYAQGTYKTVKKRYKKKGRWKKDKRIARTGYRLAKKALSMLNVEYKYVDQIITNVNVTTTPTFLSFPVLQQGTNVNTRNGDSIKVTALYIKAMIDQDSADFTSQMRIMLIHDKQANGAEPAVTDILNDTSSFDVLVSPLNLDNKFRFSILHDELILLDNVAHPQHFLKYYKSFENMHIRYGGNVGDVTDLKTDNIFLMYLSNQVGNTPGMTLSARLRFVDN